MSIKDQTTLRVVLYEGSDAQPLEAADRFTAMTALLERGFAVTRVASGGQVAPADRTSLLVLGRFNEGRVPRGEDADGLVNLRFKDVTGFDANRIAVRPCCERISAMALANRRATPSGSS